MNDRRCYVCNASEHDGCQAIGGEVAECPRPDTRLHRVQWSNEGRESEASRSSTEQVMDDIGWCVLLAAAAVIALKTLGLL